MARTLAVHVHLTCEPGKREKLFKHYRPIVAASQAKPGVIAYFVGTPVNDESETEIVVFELYADRDAFNAHLVSPEMKEFRTQTADLIKQSTVRLATPLAHSFLRPPAAVEPGLSILANMEYAETADMEEVLAKASRLIAHTQSNEPATQSYFWAVEEGNPQSIWVFEQFESPEFCFGTHMKTELFIEATSAQAEGLVARPTFAKREFGFVRAWV
ncbi:hypothetical protein BDW59DRAFT_163200 [Aspergillus cavernicola]|uniref:ABM domain-containing protein n=1 Tax=Aspergillus cavernicola TaxID=176166 RepID=A0ABR4I7J1_9EURO